LGPFRVPGLQDGGDLHEQGRKLVEDRGCGPFDQSFRVHRKQVADQQRDPAAHKGVQEAVRGEGGAGGLQHYHQDRRDRSLVYKHRAAPEEDRRGHRQQDHGRDLQRPRPYDEHQQIRHHEPHRHPEHHLDGPPRPAAERDAQGDDGGYGREKRALVTEQHPRQEERQARRRRGLRDGPDAGPEPRHPVPEQRPDPGEQIGSFPRAGGLPPQGPMLPFRNGDLD